MKKISIFSALLLSVALSVSGADFGGKKFYINPGHGGHDSDDRPTPLPLGVEMFYESDGTLARGKYLAEFIKANNGAYKMSRTTNTTADDLALSTIAAQSNSYAGYFMSLHSNAANASANYVVGFFRSSSTAKTTETISGSKAMTQAAVDWHDDTKLTNLTFTTARALGDYSFYGYNLGVLRTNSRRGYLMETWFHDYRPEGLRMKSAKYNKFTAWQLCRALLVNPGGSGSMKGCIIGDIRNTSKGCGYSNYTSRGRDTYLAINGAKVTLTNSAGTQVASMTTDNCCNGVYAFFDLDAGEYTLKVTKSGYASKTAKVTVANNKSTLHNFSISEGVDEGLSVDATSHDFGTVEIGKTKSFTVKVTGAGLPDKIAVTSSKAVFTVDNASLAKTGGDLKITFTPTAVGNISGKITLTSGSFKATVSLTAIAKNPPLSCSGGWRYGSASNATAATPPGDWLPNGNWNLLRNMAYGNGKLYIVNASGSEIYVVNSQTCELITKLQMPDDVIKDGTYKVMDVKVVGKKIIACNLATDATQPTRVYLWNNDYAIPTCILSTTTRGSVARMGDTFDIDGNLTTGRLLFVGKNPSTGNHKVVTYAITDGQVSATPVNYGVKSDDGKYLDLGSSPRVVHETDGRFWVMGGSLQPTLLGADGISTKSINTECLGDVIIGNAFKRFKFKGDSYAVATTYPAKGTTCDGKTVTTLGTYGMMALLDGNDGWASAKLIKNYPAKGVGTANNDYRSTSVCVKVHTDANGNDYGVEMWVLISKQGMQYYKYCETGKTLPKPTLLEAAATDVTTDLSDEDCDFGQVEIGKKVTKKVKIEATGIYSDLKVIVGTGGTTHHHFSVTPNEIKFDPSKLTATGTVTITYAPTEVGSHYFNLRFDGQDKDGTVGKIDAVKIVGEGIDSSSENPDPTDPEDPADDPVIGNDDEGPSNDNVTTLYHRWSYSATGNTLSNAPWFVDDIAGNYTRDIAATETKVYALNGRPWGKFEINIIDAMSGYKIGSLNMNGVSGGQTAASSICVLGDKLLLSNGARTTDVLKVYIWDDDDQAPRLILEDASHYSLAVGDLMGVSGDLDDGYIYFSDGAKVLAYHMTNGEVDVTPELYTLSKDDEAVNVHTLNNGMVHTTADQNGSFWVTGKDSHPIHFDSNGEFIEQLGTSEMVGGVHGTSMSVIHFGKRTYLAGITYLEPAQTATASPKAGYDATLRGGAISLIDASDGTYKNIGVFPENGLGNERNTTFTSRVTHTLTSDKTRLNVYVMVGGQGIAAYTFNGNTNTGVDEVAGDDSELGVVTSSGKLIFKGNVADAQVFSLSGAMLASNLVQAENLNLVKGIYIVALKGMDGSVKAVKVATR